MDRTQTASPPSHREVLDSFYDAEQRYVDAGGAPAGVDFGEMAAHLHPDVVARQGPTVPFPGEWHGAEALQDFFALFTDTWSSLDLSEITTFEGDTGLAIEMRMRATARATGKHLDTRVAHVITFEDGLIREIDVFYRDPVAVKQVTLPDGDDDQSARALADRAAIIDVTTRFATSLDRRDWESYGACLADELEISLPFREGWVRMRRQELMDFASRLYAQMDASQHISANHQVRVLGDTATCTSTLNATHYFSERHEERLQREVGYYEYDLARTAAGWQITRMLMTISWVEGNTGALRRMQSDAALPTAAV